MQSFRNEFETNGLVQQDILDLAKKIQLFRKGKIDEESFRSLRLARGVYGQRQFGVQMVRIKLPYGKVLSNQLRRIAEVSDEYSTGHLHITTRQDIQIHYVDLDRTPELWADLERDDVTIREACGNTVRNVTASETAGIDTKEPFDVSPYADAVFRYFLRNPVSQEMGRKFKVSFSSSDEDTGLSYLHDLGFIAKIQEDIRGFQVMLGGGLGSQPRHADLLYDFLPTDQIIPLMEAIIRVFDRYGERKNRAKARLKFLLNDLGLEGFKKLIEEERITLEDQIIPIDYTNFPYSTPVEISKQNVFASDSDGFQKWKKINTTAQKQKEYYAVGVKVKLGNFTSEQARSLAELVDQYAAGELRFTLRQDILIPFVREDLLPLVYDRLNEIGLADVGYNKSIDVTACPGTDTCNLAISNSTGLSLALEEVLATEYPQLAHEANLVIKVSGCMNACGQHTMAHIGFQGMSIKSPDGRVAPAVQVLLGGANLGGGRGIYADKVVKMPTHRAVDALRIVLDDFEANGVGFDFSEYYEKQGKMYFYELLAPLTEVSNLSDNDFVDWGSDEPYRKAIGIGECAGVQIDLVSSILYDGQEKLKSAQLAFEQSNYSHAIYYAYSALIQMAKALLVSEDITTNSQANIIDLFDENFVSTGKFNLDSTFADLVYQIREYKPAEEFAKYYLEKATEFGQLVDAYRTVEA